MPSPPVLPPTGTMNAVDNQRWAGKPDMPHWFGMYGLGTVVRRRAWSASDQTSEAPQWAAVWLSNTPSGPGLQSTGPAGPLPAGSPFGGLTSRGIHQSQSGPTGAAAAAGSKTS